MAHGRVNAAKFISRYLPEPHETELGAEPAHQLLATAHADWVCPPSGHRIGWNDCYSAADILPLTLKADLFLEGDGTPRRIPAHLTGEQHQRAVKACELAVRIRREAPRCTLH
ncbi:hypothetical protein OG226_41205 [Streptomyces sp. NBC_01261]|uniref:hypothetical protein n=1 Tax=Streptomyces sp. NBC_01261 TaxID=2903802 RepID=UPI002E3509B7|nr:hypothetical protein [Streptomyces sp. NBC_01261]